MTYNTSRACVLRMKGYLETMFAGRRSLTWPSREPEKLARRIREAMKAVQHHPEFKHYIPLKTWYTLHARSGFVEARFLGQEEGVEPGVEALSTVKALEDLTLPDLTDLQSIVGAAIMYVEKTEELVFPDALLSYNDKLTLFKWTKQGEGGWKFIDRDDAGVVLTRKSVNPILLWRPE